LGGTGLTIQTMRVRQKFIDGVTLDYVGSLDDHSLIVVVGRSNYKKSSKSLDSFLKDLHAAGHSICWFETRRIQTSKLLDDQFKNLRGSMLCDFCNRHALIGRPLRKLIKVTLLLKQPERWDYFFDINGNKNQNLARSLSKLLRNLTATQVCLFSHSAGGIVSSLSESEKSVRKMVCFGYPFKHPEQDEDPVRTAHLERVSKPFLIIQGDEDEYGSAQDSKRYKLSSSIRVVPIQASHEYDNLSADEYQKILALLNDFFS